ADPVRVLRLPHWRSLVSDEVLSRSLVDQFLPQRPLRARRPLHDGQVRAAAGRPRPIRDLRRERTTARRPAPRGPQPPRRAMNETRDSRTFAVGMAAAAGLVGWAIQWNNGFYNPLALVVVSVAIAIACTVCVRPCIAAVEALSPATIVGLVA